MDTISNLPFQLTLIKTFPVRVEQKAVHFVKKEENIWKNDFCTLEAEENEELEILFKAKEIAIDKGIENVHLGNI